MKCANCLCNAESLYFRSGSLHAVDCFATEEQVEGEPILRQRVIWLCEKCSSLFTIDPWRPPGEQMHPRTPGLGSYREAKPQRASGDKQDMSRTTILLDDFLIRS